MGKIVCLISCVSQKKTKLGPAKDIYVSQWFKKAARYAGKNADEWYVLSAKYFLVDPNQLIEPYDLTLRKMKVEDRKAWAKKIFQMLGSFLAPEDRITILAGKLYRENLVPLILERGCKVDVPMAGMRIGEQLRWLKENTEEKIGQA